MSHPLLNDGSCKYQAVCWCKLNGWRGNGCGNGHYDLPKPDKPKPEKPRPSPPQPTKRRTM